MKFELTPGKLTVVVSSLVHRRDLLKFSVSEDYYNVYGFETKAEVLKEIENIDKVLKELGLVRF